MPAKPLIQNIRRQQERNSRADLAASRSWPSYRHRIRRSAGSDDSLNSDSLRSRRIVHLPLTLKARDPIIAPVAGNV